MRTSLCVELFWNGISGVLQLLEEAWRDGEEVDTCQRLDLASLPSAMV